MLFRSWWGISGIVAWTAVLVWGCLSHDILLAGLGAAWLFSYFDMVGYGELIDDTGYEHLTPFYRILQITFQVALCLMLFVSAGWRAPLVFMVVWWFGGCDLVYYMLRDEIEEWVQDYNTPEMFNEWMWWTPLGLLRIRITYILFLTQAILGWLIALIIGGFECITKLF